MFVRSEGDDPRWFAFGFTCGILSETEVRYPVFIGHELAVVPGGERFITEDFVKFWEMFDQMFKLFGIVPIPWCGGKPVDHTSVNVNADVKFETISSATLSFDPDVVPGTTVVGAESTAVNSNCHLFPSEEPGDSVHHLPYVRDGEPFHSALNHAMPWENRVVLSEGLAVFNVCFDAVVGLVESNFKETSYCYGLWVVSFSSFAVRFPWWRQLVYRFDHRLGELGGKVAVDMVRNCWINPFLCTSHPAKKRMFPP